MHDEPSISFYKMASIRKRKILWHLKVFYYENLIKFRDQFCFVALNTFRHIIFLVFEIFAICLRINKLDQEKWGKVFINLFCKYVRTSGNCHISH